jgi:hypothetical protein
MSVRVYIDMGIPMHNLSHTYLSLTNEEEEAFEILCLGLVFFVTVFLK